MVVSKQVEIPNFRGIGRQRGRAFGGLAQVFGRKAIPFSRKYVVPAAKRVGVDLMESVAPKIADVVSGKKLFQEQGKECGKANLEKKQLGSGSKQTGVIPTKSTKQLCRSRRDFFMNFSR